MQYKDNKKILKDFQSKLEKLIMRNFIEGSIEDYDENETYIVYDTNKIEVFDQMFLELNKGFKHFGSYFISKPFKI